MLTSLLSNLFANVCQHMQKLLIILQCPAHCTMPFTDLKVVMKSLLDDGKYADMKISCQEHDCKCHRAVICSQSPFFDAALKNGFKVSGILNLPVVVMIVLLTDMIGSKVISSQPTR